MNNMRPLFDLQSLAQTDFASCRTSPWALITVGLVHVKLAECCCRQCAARSLVQTVIASTVALLHEDSVETAEARKSLGASNALDLSLKAMDSPCWVTASHIALKDLQTPLPKFVKEFMLRESSKFSYPLAGLKRVDGFMTHTCPGCFECLQSTNKTGVLVLVTDSKGEALPEPMAAIATI